MQLSSGNYSYSNNYLGVGGTANIYAVDPLFADTSDLDGADNIYRTDDDGLFLKSNSPCIDTGNYNAGVASVDILGLGHFKFVDLGAYEYNIKIKCPSVDTLYVDSSVASSGNGDSWGNAFKNLAEALNVAQRCARITTILVAKGTYLPTMKFFQGGIEAYTTDPRDVTFHIRDGLKLYGGFANGGGKRNSQLYTTVLSGDIGVSNSAADNAYHILLAVGDVQSAGITVDGFTIADAVANGTKNYTINGTIIYQTHGGGIFIIYGKNNISNNNIINCYSGYGAGMYIFYGDYILNNNNFLGNTAVADGGAIYNFYGNTLISNSKFSKNSSSNFGGAIIGNQGSLFVKNNLIANNSSRFGGGLYLYSGKDTVVNNDIVNNSATQDGGAFYNYYGNIYISNNTIAMNTAADQAGGILSNQANNNVMGNIISKNTAKTGGAAFLYYGNDTLSNNTITNNDVTSNAGGVFTMGGSHIFNNNIHWGNGINGSTNQNGSDYSNANGNGAVVKFNNNLLQMASSNYNSGNSNDLGTQANNIFASDPLLSDTSDIDGADNIHRTADDGLILKSGSPMIDNGTSGAAIPAFDILGKARLGKTDIGAYEYRVNVVCPKSDTLYVDSAVTSSGAGTSWSSAFKSLTEALALAHSCPIVTTVLVAKGTYIPSKKPYDGGKELTTSDNRDVTFHVRNHLKLYGGYSNGGGTRDIKANVTTLSGDIGTANVNTDNAFHVVLAEGVSGNSFGITIDGFNITGGYADGTNAITINGLSISPIYGGGILSFYGLDHMSNNNIYNNTATYGAAIYMRNGNNSLLNNNIIGNTANQDGAGLYTDSGNVYISNNIISNSTAKTGGGAIQNRYANLKIVSNQISGNNGFYGGAMSLYYGTDTLINNNIKNNIATNDGGAFNLYSEKIYISSNTITGNTATGNFGGGIYTKQSQCMVVNNNFSNNSSKYGGAVYLYKGTDKLINNTLYKNGASQYGGAIVTNSGTYTFINNILWGNHINGNSTVTQSDYYKTGSTNTFSNNLMQLASSDYGTNSNDLGTASNNIFATNPMFADSSDMDGNDNIDRNGDDGLTLKLNSSAIDAGLSGANIPSLDITGGARFGGLTDIGAYEYRVNIVCPKSDTIYVDSAVASSGVGTSWPTAFKSLTEALALAHACPKVTTVLVAKGTYIPGKKPFDNGVELVTSDPRDVTFHFRSGVSIYGGFANGGSTRNVMANPTILSGDIGMVNNISDNTYHVVLAFSNDTTKGVILDGLTIEYGFANNSNPMYGNNFGLYRNIGAGVYLVGGKNIISNNIFEFDSAFGDGGGIMMMGSRSIIYKNSFIQNSSTFASGAAIASFYDTSVIDENLFINNKALNGGGIAVSRGKIRIVNNTFLNNSVNNTGGAFYLDLGIYEITSNVIRNNTAKDAAGIAVFNSTGTIKGNSIISNKASSICGGVYLGNGKYIFSNNSLIKNASNDIGGGLLSISCNNLIYNNIIANNIAVNGGSGLILASDTSVLSNNTITNNSAIKNMGAFILNGGKVVINNNIFWNNLLNGQSNLAKADYSYSGVGDYTFNNNVLQLDSINYTSANINDLGKAINNKFAKDPMLLDTGDIDGIDNIYFTKDDGLSLKYGSTCIDAGINNSGVPANDIVGQSRAGAVDIGAYEYILPCPTGTDTLYVDGSISVSGTGTSWTSAFKQLSEALEVTHKCMKVTTILVAKGTYKPTKLPFVNGVEIASTDPHDITFHIRDGLKVYGGFPNGGGARDIKTNTTTLSGNIGAASSNFDNAYHVILTSAQLNTGNGFLLDGFTITDGRADGSTNIVVNAITMDQNNGAGLAVYNGKNFITNNIFTNNISGYFGGAIYTKQDSSLISYNTVTNDSAGYGGGIYSDNSKHIFNNNTFIGNISSDGGALFIMDGNCLIINNVMAKNNATNGGGITAYGSTNATMSNNTIWSNSASNIGGGVYTNGGQYTFNNNIFWGNTSKGQDNIATSDYTGGSNVTFNNNLMQLDSIMYKSSNNNALTNQSKNLFKLDPMFNDTSDLDGVDNIHRTSDDGLSLKNNSPCLNTGISGANIPTLDIAGNARVGLTDIGAYESKYVNGILSNNLSKDLIQVYPNPTNGILYIQSHHAILGYQLWNNLGQLVSNESAIAKNNMVFDLSSYPSGMYIIRIQTSDGTESFRILKQ